VGDRWTLLLVRDLLRGARRFQDFQTSLPGIPPNILSDRLKLMEEHGLVTRRLYSDHPPRAEYALTDKGRELGVVVGALAAWGSRHVHRQTALVHAACGAPRSSSAGGRSPARRRARLGLADPLGERAQHGMSVCHMNL